MSASERPCALMRDLILPLVDALPSRVDCFIRDDDAGWDDVRLLALLDVTERCGLPIDLAAIPRAMTPSLARELLTRMNSAPHRLGVHQHGYAHANHEREGRQCEFGASRDAAAQGQDLALGWALLREHFGPALLPIFTPPWNRCSETTPSVLAAQGFRALSRDRRAQPPQDALAEIAVDLDWSKYRGDTVALASAWARALSERSADGRPFGLMLHHAAMASEELAELAALLASLASHPCLRWRSMRELLAPPTPTLDESTACTTSA